MKIEIMQYEEFFKYREDIEKLIFDSYIKNFNITDEYCNKVAKEKISSLDYYIKEGKAILIAATEKDFLAGFIWIYKHEYYDELRLHVNQVIVENNYKKMGLGRSLMNEAEKLAIGLGIKTIDLFVSENNSVALNLYTQLGFVTERRYLKKNL